MPAYEVHEWRMYDAMYPFGDERADWRAAQIAFILAASNSKRRPKFGDFLWQPPKTKRRVEADIRASLNKHRKKT